MGKVILVTGASSGIGLACANALVAKGHIVYGSSRNLNKIKAVSFKPIELDVTDEDSAKSAINHIINTEGRIDVLVNNAGNGVAGPAYAMPNEYAKKQFEVNFFGVVRMCSTTLPHMIDKNEGLIVNISSLAGLFGLPYQSMYCASKFAIEGYSQSLRMELNSTKIKIALVNPGDFRSDFTQNREKVPFTIKNEKLASEFNAAVAGMEKDESIGSDPAIIGKKLCQIVETANPSQNYLVGKFDQTMVPGLKKILPKSIFIKLMNDHYGIK